jgi:hypothetical protein
MTDRNTRRIRRWEICESCRFHYRNLNPNGNRCEYFDQVHLLRNPPCSKLKSKFFNEESRLALKETYLAVLKKKRDLFPDDYFEVITLTAGSVLAPSDRLLNDVKFLQKQFETMKVPNEWARWMAWDNSDYENRYRQQLKDDPEAQERIKTLIKKMVDGQSVWVVCYEKYPPCHRFVLWDILRASCASIHDYVSEYLGLDTPKHSPATTLDDFMRL